MLFIRLLFINSILLGLTCITPLAAVADDDFIVNYSCITDSPYCSTGEAQLTTGVSDYGNNKVLFKFYNTGEGPSSISEIYFDDGTLLDVATLIDVDNGGLSGVDFEPGAAPPNLPDGDLAEPEFVATQEFSVDADAPPTKDGVNVGEWLGIVFNLQSGMSFDSVIQDLQDGGLRIGLHVIAFESGSSGASFVNLPIPVPLPAALGLFLMSLISLGLGRIVTPHRTTPTGNIV